MAKWILGDGLKVLVLDHPTRGLDIGAKEDLYAVFRDLSDRGVAILVLADTLDEAIGLGHRVIVMRDARSPARSTRRPETRPANSNSSRR